MRRKKKNTSSAGSAVILLSDRSSSMRAVKFLMPCLCAVESAYAEIGNGPLSAAYNICKYEF